MPKIDIRPPKRVKQEPDASTPGARRNAATSSGRGTKRKSQALTSPEPPAPSASRASVHTQTASHPTGTAPRAVPGAVDMAVGALARAELHRRALVRTGVQNLSGGAVAIAHAYLSDLAGQRSHEGQSSSADIVAAAASLLSRSLVLSANTSEARTVDAFSPQSKRAQLAPERVITTDGPRDPEF